jgi:hypothetical protein
VGPFEVVENKGPVAYCLALPDSLRHVHDVFHVSVLRHYVSDPAHVIDMSSLPVSDEGALKAVPIHILDHRIRKLQRRTVNQVKVQWENYSPRSTTWEDAYDMRQQFPYLFDSLDIYILSDNLFTTFYILYKFRMKFKTRGGVCNITLLRAHVIGLFFEDTCIKVIQL